MSKQDYLVLNMLEIWQNMTKKDKRFETWLKHVGNDLLCFETWP
jgi:hypothetical protein